LIVSPISRSPLSPPASNRSFAAKEAGRGQDRYARELAENEKIAIAGDEGDGIGCDGEMQEDVVIGIARDRHRLINPIEASGPANPAQELPAIPVGNARVESRPKKNGTELAEGRWGEGQLVVSLRQAHRGGRGAPIHTPAKQQNRVGQLPAQNRAKP
jgi:hypothetical protein